MRSRQMRGGQLTTIHRLAALRPRLLVAPLLIAAFLALCATPALAGKTHAPKTTFGSLFEPSGIAIDEANGNVFVDRDNNSIEIFGAEGGAPVGVAVTKIEGFDLGHLNGLPSGIAIDNSPASPAKGALYVTDVNNDAVKKFVLNGSEEYELKDELTVEFSPLGVAVDAKGNAFVSNFAEFGHSPSIVEFSPAGAELAQIDTKTTLGHPSALAFDSAGDLYVQPWVGQGVWKYLANGSGEIEPTTTPTQITRGSPTGIAIDQGTDTLYVAEKTRVKQYSASCTPIATPFGPDCEPELEFGLGTLGSAQRVAVAPNGDIYVADREKGDVAVFELATSIVPDPVTEEATQVKQTAATLNGTLSAAEGPPASCEFQYATKASFDVEGFKGASAAPCSPAGPFSGAAANTVKADISGLSAETTYVFRLLASNENGLNLGATLSLDTVGRPKIDATSIAQVTLDSATLEGLINPNSDPNAAVETTYAFEYVSEDDFKASEYAKAIEVPLGGEAIGSGTKDVKVAQQLSGLSAHATYHFRIVAENEAGEEIGPDKTFTTYREQDAGLPDGRAYEQATPVDKGGASAQGLIDFVRAARDGGGITFFSNGGIPGGEGAQQFPMYISARKADGSGWSTQGALPPESNGASAWVKGFDEELSQVYVAQAKLPGEPQTFYQRDSSSHALRAIAAEVEPAQTHDAYAGESADGSEVLIEAVYGATHPPGAVKGQNAFVWDKATETLSLAGVLNKGQAPAGGTSAGSYDVGGPTTYTSYEHPISSDGSRVFFSSLGGHQVYLRQNPTQPQSSLDGAGNCVEPELACTIQISASQRTIAPLKDEKAATLWAATPDGRRAFFTSPGKLTDDATTGPSDAGNDLYRYDAESGELVDLTPDLTDPNGAEVQGLLGISDDGSHVYFVANGVLAANQGADGSHAALGDCANNSGQPELVQFTVGTCNLYLWHDGLITYVAPQQASPPTDDDYNWLRRPAGQEKMARVSADGSALLFRSREQLTAYDNEGFAEFYRYSAGEGNLICVSCNPSGAGPVGSAVPQSIGVVAAPEAIPAPVQTRNMSADGERVFFESPDKLVASDTNGEAGCPAVKNGSNFFSAFACQDVYEWEAKGAGSCESEDQNGGCLYLISSGTSPRPSYFADASASGGDVFFFTPDRLVGQDKDQIVDIYDARIGGGIPNPPPPVPCEGEACKGAPSPPPATQSPGSAAFSGPGNQKPAHKHKKRQHKKKRQHSKQHKKRHATPRHGRAR